VTYGTLATDLKTLVETLELEDPTLVGLSMGGRIAHVCAAAYPEVPGSIVTYEAPVRLEPLSLSLSRRLLMQIHRTVYRYIGPYRAYQIYNWYRHRFGDVGDDESNPAIDGLGMTKTEYIRDAIKRVDAAEQLNLMNSFGEEIDTPSEISVPSLVLTGDGASSFNIEAAEQLVSEIPDARRETIPDAGHAGNMDNPDAFNQTLREFISTVHPIDSKIPE
jgi:pimeloyl-ACP methyl ester carboxylesterase